MSNSSLVSYTRLSPNHSGKRNHKIDRITPHCVAGQCSVETIGDIFASPSRQASSNYAVGVDGRIGLYVDECNRSWCSSSKSNDHRAVTIEIASDKRHPYTMKDIAYNAFLDLTVDICKRNGIKKLLWMGSKEATLNYEPKEGEATLSAHRWFANKSCPGDWLYSRYPDIAKIVTARLSGLNPDKMYRVQTGAFSKKENAVELLHRVQSAGFDTHMVKHNGLYKIQVGAYLNPEYAENMASKLKAKGFDTYITVKQGDPVSISEKKTIDEIAHEVIEGLWGNGEDRKNRLVSAGYDYDEVQKRVNQIL